MLKIIFKILFKLQGWTLYQPSPPEAKNCVMVAAPHTSNWDFIFAISALDQLHLNPRFTIKKEFNVFLLGPMIQNLGAIWIDRNKAKKLGMTDFMKLLFDDNQTENLTIVVTPEASRSKVVQWKTGFYFAALKSSVPICLAFMDYEKKLTGVGMCFMPSGDIDKDMGIIMDYYRSITPKFPEKFATDERYTH
ncbi:MAG: 1-acyl-sn-glycerol-3-phosphate acyltransferase [Cyclobacteriaceae bacterium]|jgi:1-acyl-sn-glycerol-3-phosphate acyltransferase